MKKILIAICFVVAAATTFSQSNQIFYGTKTARLAGVVLTENKTYMFPTYGSQAKNYDNDSITVTVSELETYVTVDSIGQTEWIILSPTSRVLAGAKVYLNLQWDALVPSTVYVKQGSYVLDTITLGDAKTNRTYQYNGTRFTTTNSYAFPTYQAAVTQASSITTGVTCNADAGVITTVSSTIAADDSSASFTLTNSFIKAGSTILLTTGTAGNGIPVAHIASQTAGSAVLKLSNTHRQAALNNTVKVHFLILNK